MAKETFFKNHVNRTLLFCPFDAPLVEPLQQFPASCQLKKDNNTLLSGFLLFAFLPSSCQKDKYHTFNCNKEETGRGHR